MVCARAAIPWGIKLTLRQGAATGVVSVYRSGKVVANPKAQEHFAGVLAALTAARGAGAAAAGRELLVVPYPCLGSDESGKGDYFGPLAVAAALVADEREARLLQELGVRDSKELGSPEAARVIAAQVREVLRGRFSEVVLEPEEYNRRFAALKSRGQNSHAMLAQAHVEAWSGIVGSHRPAIALWDRFGSGREVEREARSRGLSFALRSETRGERWVAVAAASILARDRCLEWFVVAEARSGLRLPRGAFDPGIVTAARRLWAEGGEPRLRDYAKLHFRTTEKVIH